MADRNKFEEMLEKLVNEDRAGAEELFHEIVVEKSRDIYENLLEDDLEVDEANDEEVDEATDEEVDEATDEVEESGDKSEAEQMREYVEKVSGGGLDAQKIGGDNGANAKSPVASANKMGDGTSANIVAGGEAGPGGTAGGLAGNSPKVDNMGNINVPGGKAGKAMKPMSKGHGAEKKGAGETADNKKSIVGK